MKIFAGFLLFFFGQQTYDYSPPIVGLVASGNGYAPMTASGTAGQSYDYAPATILLGYNPTAKKYYACGSSNPCTGSGSAVKSGYVTLVSGTNTHTFTTPFTSGTVACNFQDTSALAVTRQTAASLTGFTVTGTGSDVIGWTCTNAGDN